MLVDATASQITFTFYSTAGGGTVFDSYTLKNQNTVNVPEASMENSSGSDAPPTGAGSTAPSAVALPAETPVAGIPSDDTGKEKN